MPLGATSRRYINEGYMAEGGDDLQILSKTDLMIRELESGIYLVPDDPVTIARQIHANRRSAERAKI